VVLEILSKTYCLVVSLGLYGDSRTQGGGKLDMIARDKGKTTDDKERT
jgi:hypothetical protein